MTSLGSFHGRMIEFSTYGMGWNGIAVALVARYNPAGVIPAAFLLAYLITGANSAGLLSDIPPEVSQVVIASIYYLITAQAILQFRFKKGRA
jgi:simple sugar transport system permease protein